MALSPDAICFAAALRYRSHASSPAVTGWSVKNFSTLLYWNLVNLAGNISTSPLCHVSAAAEQNGHFVRWVLTVLKHSHELPTLGSWHCRLKSPLPVSVVFPPFILPAIALRLERAITPVLAPNDSLPHGHPDPTLVTAVFRTVLFVLDNWHGSERRSR